MHSPLFGNNLEVESGVGMTLQNPRLLKLRLQGEAFARQGAMVAYQGQVEFAFQGGGIGRFLKKAITGEGLPVMRMTGQGDVFLARDADEIFLVDLEGDSLTVNGANVLAFEAGLSWDVKRVEGASMFAGGVFNTVFTGHGRVAISCHGSPVVLDCSQVPTFADLQSAVAWSTSLQTSLQRSATGMALLGRGSGEAFQLGFRGPGFVVVQASEGPTVPPHSHGG